MVHHKEAVRNVWKVIYDIQSTCMNHPAKPIVKKKNLKTCQYGMNNTTLDYVCAMMIGLYFIWTDKSSKKEQNNS